MEAKTDQKKTHIIAITPQNCLILGNSGFEPLFEDLAISVNPWLHITLSQYTEPSITPTICYRLQEITSVIPSFPIIIKGLNYWEKSKVLYLDVQKSPLLKSTHHIIRNIFWSFFPNFYLKNWYELTAFWTPHISLAYNIEKNTALKILTRHEIKPFMCIANCVVLRDFDTKYKEFHFEEIA